MLGSSNPIVTSLNALCRLYKHVHKIIYAYIYVAQKQFSHTQLTWFLEVLLKIPRFNTYYFPDKGYVCVHTLCPAKCLGVLYVTCTNPYLGYLYTCMKNRLTIPTQPIEIWVILLK